MSHSGQPPTRLPMQIAAVTGASRGLGAAFARVLSEEGFVVALGARDLAAVERLASELPGAPEY